MGRRKSIDWNDHDIGVVTAYLVVKSNGNVRVTQNPPRLLAKEIAIKLNFTLSKDLFSLQLPEANMSLTEKNVIEPSVEIKMKYAMEHL